MIDQELENNLRFAADVQRKAGWSEKQIAQFAHQQRVMVLGFLEQIFPSSAKSPDESRSFDPSSPEVKNKIAEAKADLKVFEERLEARAERLKTAMDNVERLLSEVYADSGFRNLYEPLQEEIERHLNPRAGQGDNHEQ
jgi:hypothetical protein